MDKHFICFEKIASSLECPKGSLDLVITKRTDKEGQGDSLSYISGEECTI